MFQYLLLVALIPAVVLGQTNGVRRCPLVAQANFPHEVRVHGCTDMPCHVARGSDAVMEFDFTPSALANDLTPTVWATVLGLPVNYPLPPANLDSCSNLVGTQCPVPAGQRTTLVFRFPVNPLYPPIGVAVQLTLRNHLNNVVTCFSVDIQVTN